MKGRAWILLSLGLAAMLFAAFTFGFLLGRSSVSAAFTVETALRANVSPSPVISGEAEPMATWAGGPVNINTAGPEELQTLPGIGSLLAERIIRYRDSYGAFQTVEELCEVYGIGDKLFEAIRDRITVE